MKTVPVIRAASSGPTTVTSGINELRSACRMITTVCGPPLAIAEVTYSSRSVSNMLERT